MESLIARAMQEQTLMFGIDIDEAKAKAEHGYIEKVVEQGRNEFPAAMGLPIDMDEFDNWMSTSVMVIGVELLSQSAKKNPNALENALTSALMNGFILGVSAMRAHLKDETKSVDYEFIGVNAVADIADSELEAIWPREEAAKIISDTKDKAFWAGVRAGEMKARS